MKIWNSLNHYGRTWFQLEYRALTDNKLPTQMWLGHNLSSFTCVKWRKWFPKIVKIMSLQIILTETSSLLGTNGFKQFFYLTIFSCSSRFSIPASTMKLWRYLKRGLWSNTLFLFWLGKMRDTRYWKNENDELMGSFGQ